MFSVPNPVGGEGCHLASFRLMASLAANGSISYKYLSNFPLTNHFCFPVLSWQVMSACRPPSPPPPLQPPDRKEGGTGGGPCPACSTVCMFSVPNPVGGEGCHLASFRLMASLAANGSISYKYLSNFPLTNHFCFPVLSWQVMSACRPPSPPPPLQPPDRKEGGTGEAPALPALRCVCFLCLTPLVVRVVICLPSG